MDGWGTTLTKMHLLRGLGEGLTMQNEANLEESWNPIKRGIYTNRYYYS